VTAPGQKGWILWQMQEVIKGYAGVTTSTSDKAIDMAGVINYYNPYRGFRGKCEIARDIVFCTHPEVEPLFWESAKQADATVVMNQQYRDALIEIGVPAERIALIYPGVDEHMDCRLVIYNPSRLNANEGYFARKGITDWYRLQECKWLNCVCSNGRWGTSVVRDWYQRCDAVVSTATMEGGPMAIIEGMAHGKPCYYRHGVGLGEDFGSIAYNDVDDLIDMLYASYLAKRAYADKVQACTLERWGVAHKMLFDEVWAAR